MILDPTLTVAYLVVATAVALSPGPDFMFVVATAMRHKVKGAIASALGIGAGVLVHTFAAAVGVSAIVASSPMAFDILRYCGALYLAYLGVIALRSWYLNKDGANRIDKISETSLVAVFRRGLLTNLLNPKVVVFYLALLPQFISVELGHVGVQMFLLGCLHNFIGVTFLIVVGSATGRASSWLEGTKFGRWLDGIAGLFFIGLAFRLAVSGRPEK